MRLISYRLPDDGPGDAIRVGIALPGSSGADSSATVRPRIVPLADLAGRAAGRTALGPETASLDLRGLLRADPGLQSTRAALATAVGAGVAACDSARAAIKAVNMAISLRQSGRCNSHRPAASGNRAPSLRFLERHRFPGSAVPARIPNRSSFAPA